MREIERVEPDVVEVSANRRTLNDARVSEIAESMSAVGLVQPITVRHIKDDNGERLVLVAGHHRLAAAISLGWQWIDALVLDSTTDADCELIEIDENLMRSELTESERAYYTARRKEVYEAMHPETAYDARPGRAGKCRQNDDNSTDRFTADTAKKTGKSEATIQRAAKRGKALGEDALAVAGTSLDKGVELDALAKLPPDERAPLIEKAKAGEKVSARKPVAPPDPPLNSIEVSNKSRQALMRAWNKASREDRDWFLAEIDRPVFDRTSAGGDR